MMIKNNLQQIKRIQAGFSLIEVMVAIAIGMLITAALFTLFVNVNRTNTEMEKSNSQIENGRFAIQLIQNDLIHAGYWGGYIPKYDNLSYDTAAPDDYPSAIPDPCLAFVSWNAAYKNNLIGLPVQAYSTAPSTCASVVTNQKSNTDMLVIRHAANCIAGTSATAGDCEAYNANKLYFQSSLCKTEDQNTYILATSGFSLHKKDCATTADLRKFVSSIYYVRDYTKTVGDGIPTLMRSSFDYAAGSLAHQAPQALIDGIEGFHIEYGIDRIGSTGIDIISDATAANQYTAAIKWADSSTMASAVNRGDGIPDGLYVPCGSTSGCTAAAHANVSVAQLTHAVAARIYVLARNTTETTGYTDTKTYQLGSVTLGPFNDHFKRHLFSTTVRFVNISGRREVP
ncbi:PilW family protein [Leeia oryzae]|uniref:PilW family protein n=1 Tax=Leeia oryzae TaxID=356662 RepID=UPI0003A2CC30|nr:PilW family protein [Leeia oryzae]